MSVSTSSYSSMSLMAVFSPMPGTPGTLSAESPMRASRSMNWAGSKPPYFSRKVSGVSRLNTSPM